MEQKKDTAHSHRSDSRNGNFKAVISDSDSDSAASLWEASWKEASCKDRWRAAFLSTNESNVFAIEATGNREGAQQGFGIRAIVTFGGNTGYRYVYYKSPAQVEP